MIDLMSALLERNHKNISQTEFSDFLLNKKFELEKQFNTYKYQVIDLPNDWGYVELSNKWVQNFSIPFSETTLKELEIGKVVYCHDIFWLIRGKIK